MLRKTAPIGALEGTSYSTSMPSSSDSMRSWPTGIHRCWLRCLCSQAKCSSSLLPAAKRVCLKACYKLLDSVLRQEGVPATPHDGLHAHASWGSRAVQVYARESSPLWYEPEPLLLAPF
jgi:hypothetical protein